MFITLLLDFWGTIFDIMNYYDNSNASSSVGYQPSRYILWQIARNNIPTLVFFRAGDGGDVFGVLVF